MSFDTETQKARADAALNSWLDIDNGHAHYTMAEKEITMKQLARYIYALAYAEGWEDSRTQP